MYLLQVLKKIVFSTDCRPFNNYTSYLFPVLRSNLANVVLFLNRKYSTDIIWFRETLTLNNG